LGIKNKMKKKTNGFTLIEFLLYSVIVTMIVSALVVTGVNIIESRAKVAVIEEVNHNGKMAMNMVTRHIREAKEINYPAQGEEGDYLSLETHASINNPTVFGKDPEGKLTIKRGGSEERRIISEHVALSDISFTNTTRPEGVGTVRIEFIIEYAGPAEEDFTRVFRSTESIKSAREGDFGE